MKLHLAPLLSFLVLCVYISVPAGEKLVRIKWNGVSPAEISQLKEQLYHYHPGFISRLFRRYPEFSSVNYQMDKRVIIAFLQNQGYLNAILQDSVITRSGKISLIYQIQKGPIYRIAGLELRKIAPEDSVVCLPLMLSTPGKPFSPLQAEKDSATLLIHYQNRGYLDASVSVTRQIREEIQQVYLGFEVQQNIRYRIGQIRYQGHYQVAAWQIRRELTFASRDYFNYDRIRESRNNLYQSGHFSYITIVPEKTSDTSQLDMVVRVTETKPHSISLFTNYLQEDQSSNLAFNLEYTVTNLFNNGQILTFNPLYSFTLKKPSLYQKIGLNLFLVERWFLAYRLPLTVMPSYYYIRNDISRYEVFGIQLQIRHGLTEKAYLLNSYSVRKKSFRGAASPEIEDQLGSGWHNGIESILEKDSRDDFFSPRDGTYLNLHQTIISRFFGGTTNYYKLKITGCYYRSSGNARLQFGFGGSLRRGEAYPLEPEERFLLGGANTIRGYQEQKLGFTDLGTGKIIGGQVFWLLNLNHFLWNWKLLRQIVFFDSGNVYTDWKNFEPWRIKSGLGTGLHLLTPIGPLRLEMGYPIGQPVRWNTLVFHLALLPMF